MTYGSSTLPGHQCPNCGAFPPYQDCYSLVDPSRPFHAACPIGSTFSFALHKARIGKLTKKDINKIPVAQRHEFLRLLIRQGLTKWKDSPQSANSEDGAPSVKTKLASLPWSTQADPKLGNIRQWLLRRLKRR
jgi:hypothetical protein